MDKSSTPAPSQPRANKAVLRVAWLVTGAGALAAVSAAITGGMNPDANVLPLRNLAAVTMLIGLVAALGAYRAAWLQKNPGKVRDGGASGPTETGERNEETRVKQWCLFIALALPAGALLGQTSRVPVYRPLALDVGSRLELFVDRFLIDRMNGVQLKLGQPVDAGIALKFDKPWEGLFCNFVTVFKDPEKYRAYYRGKPAFSLDSSNEATCYAESSDGVHWSKPELGLFEVGGGRKNNVVLDASHRVVVHNFSPFYDTRPGVPAAERYKALGGCFNMPDSVSSNPGMMAYVSADGVRWKRLREKTVINHSHYRVKYSDASPPAVFWSEAEQRYVAYLRVWLSDGAEPAAGFGGNIRWVGRTASDDFVNWTPVDFMTYGDTPVEQIYTNQTHPYFRAPHISIALAARFMALRQAVSDEEAKTLARIHGRPDMVRQCSDAVLMTTRGGTVYDRTFMEAFVRPDIGPENWTSRNNYAARGIVPTGPNEISFYVVREYGMPNAHLRRYSLPTDRFASVNAPYSGGEFVTKPLRFRGATLTLNFSTSAAGGIRVEIQDEQGNPIPGFTLNDAKEMIGNAIERPVSWKAGSDVSSLVGQVVRLRFVMKDADLYALRFR